MKTLNGNNSQPQLSQLSSEKAIVKQKLNHPQILTPSRLKPFPFGDRTGLSITGAIFRKCECGCRWVRASQSGNSTIWHCEKCNSPRLAQREKPDIQLISELLKHPDLKGWDGTFLREMERRGGALGKKQREKLRGIAQRLGAAMSQTSEIFATEAEGGEL